MPRTKPAQPERSSSKHSNDEEPVGEDLDRLLDAVVARARPYFSLSRRYAKRAFDVVAGSVIDRNHYDVSPLERIERHVRETLEDHVPHPWDVRVLRTRERHPPDALHGLLERGKDPRSKILAYGGRLDVAVVPDRLSKIVTALRKNSSRHASEGEVAAKIAFDLLEPQRDVRRADHQ